MIALSVVLGSSATPDYAGHASVLGFNPTLPGAADPAGRVSVLGFAAGTFNGTVDFGVYIPSLELSGVENRSGVGIPPLTLGGFEQRSGVIIPTFVFAESEPVIGSASVILPKLQLFSSDIHYQAGDLRAPLVSMGATGHQEPWSALTLPRITLGAHNHAGVGSITLKKPTMVATSGQSPYASATLPRMTVSGFCPPSPASFAAGTPAFTVSARAVVGGVAEITADLPTFTLFAGSGPELRGDIPLLTAVATGVSGVVATVDLRLPSVAMSSMGETAAVATASLALPAPQAAGSAIGGTLAVIAAVAPATRVASSGLSGGVATIAQALPSLGISGVMHGPYLGSVAATLPRLMAAASSTTPVDGSWSAVVVNLSNSAASEYSGMQFNSFAIFGGRVLAGGNGGVVQLDLSGTDAGTAISAQVRTGKHDFGDSHMKRVPRAFVNAAVTGDLEISTKVSETGTRAYRLVDNHTPGIQQRRVPLGKGVKSRYWQFGIANQAGADFTLHSLGVYPQTIGRRVV